jgi:NAD(P)-dependent dehydrogenase (short-subunit alcohol dehydrogenase family)
MNSLQDQVAIITGSAGGIGQAVAEVFAEDGIAGLIIADVNSDRAEKVAGDLQTRFGVDAVAATVDVSDSEQVHAMVEMAASHFKRIDILINNAGIAPVVPWPKVTEENWRQVMDVNLNGALLCTLAVLPIMQQQRAGRIVNISSAGAFVGSICTHPAYGVSKAGMIAMTKSLAKAFAEDGILVNAIAPGSIDTPLVNHFGEAQKEQLIQAAPLKRQGSSRELADAVWFLVSNRSTYVTGATLHINGGSLLV